ncbi:GNAT family N-acetyltransferase [Pseudogemmobacter bohemicus]|uniref:GNAT family N-acetyltransferase n=1 Tax=Pseudogemmobacter bohemicus TaxID=2250708 RepID=UPI000DD2B7D4|nr:GNAT family N-acetyltransferase [Pseudogemmobacter bohemicus]
MKDTVDVEITYQDLDHKGRYRARIKGIADEAELTLSKVSETLVIADHTFVPETMRGAGIARALVDHLIADARAKHFRIVPLCPYVRAQSQLHPEWADVIQN